MNAAVQRFDVGVVGAGMVGGTVATLLARAGLSVAVVEAQAPGAFDAAADIGLRVSALSPGSASILAAAGAWDRVAQTRSCAFSRMHVEDGATGAALDFEAPEFGLEALGTIVENDLLRRVLWDLLDASAMVQRFCPARVRAVQAGAEHVELQLDAGTRLRVALLIGADGADSALRGMAGVAQDVWEYNQRGVVAVVRTQRPNPHTAWQRFTAGGPLAFLPLSDGRSSIVWTRPAPEAQRLLALGDEEFTAALQEAAGGWLGQVLESGPRASFPLTMRLANHYVGPRQVLLGDAAQVVHPLAGQGVNLGLADAAALAEVLLANRRSGSDLAEHRSLQRYQRWRRSENGLMAGGIHALRSLFTPDGLAGMRGLGLRLVAASWPLKDLFLRRAAGLGRNAPRLAHGESLAALVQGP